MLMRILGQRLLYLDDTRTISELPFFENIKTLKFPSSVKDIILHFDLPSFMNEKTS